jgi:hypothetical protein
MLRSYPVVRLVLCLGFTATIMSCAGGCATATVASAGAMAGLAASAVSTSADVYQMGKLSSADRARFNDWIADVRAAAADDLHLKVVKESLDNEKGEWRCTLADDQKAKIKVFVQRRTETLCRTRIDVGLFGSEPTARLILARIRFREDPTKLRAAPEPS